MESQIEFQTSDIIIPNDNNKWPIGILIFARIFAFRLFHVFIAVANSISSNTICNSLPFLPQAVKILTNQIIRTTQNLFLFDRKKKTWTLC